MNYLEDEGLDPNEIMLVGKPNESFVKLIRKALEDSPRQRLFLTEIYQWIMENYPYYKHVDPGWRNSVRHALSTTREFVRIKETRRRYNRGSEWCLSDSILGQWYQSIVTSDSSVSVQDDSAEKDFSRLLELSTLIPELCSAMAIQYPQKPILIDLSNCPDYLLGISPHPELFVFKSIEQQLQPQNHLTEGSGYSSRATPDALRNYFNVDQFESPLSRKTSPSCIEGGFDAADVKSFFSTIE